MYKLTYVKPKSDEMGDWSAWYLDGELLVCGYDIGALDLMDAIRCVFPHLLEIHYVPEETMDIGLSELLDNLWGTSSDLEEGAWKEFNGCIEP